MRVSARIWNRECDESRWNHITFPPCVCVCDYSSAFMIVIIKKCIHTYRYILKCWARANTKYESTLTLAAAWTNSYFMAIKRQHNLCLRQKFSSSSSSILNLYVICVRYFHLRAHPHTLLLGAWRLLWAYLKFYCIQSMFFGSNVMKDI